VRLYFGVLTKKFFISLVTGLNFRDKIIKMVLQHQILWWENFNKGPIKNILKQGFEYLHLL
jgi:hypothetical protein